MREISAKPKVIEGLGLWELFRGVSILGNRELDRYIRVPAQAVPAVSFAASLLNGERTLEEADHELGRVGWRLDLEVLSEQLRRAGLLEGEPYVSDLDAMSVQWAELRIDRWFPTRWPWKVIARAALAFGFAAVLAAAWNWASGQAVRNSAASRQPIWATLIATAAGVVFSLVIHEGAHAMAGAAYGLVPRRLRFIGYLGLIPFAVLSIPGIYTLPARRRIGIWLAGPTASLALGCACYAAMGARHWDGGMALWFANMAAANTMIAIWNCCPLLPTDGYFIAGTLLRQPNWRARSWSEIRNCWRRGKTSDWLLLAYGAASGIAVGVVFARNCRRVLNWTAQAPLAGVILICLLVGALAWKRAKLYRSRLWRPRVRFSEAKTC